MIEPKITITNQDIENALKEYRDSLTELNNLDKEKKEIIRDYINELEQQRIQDLRSSI